MLPSHAGQRPSPGSNNGWPTAGVMPAAAQTASGQTNASACPPMRARTAHVQPSQAPQGMHTVPQTTLSARTGATQGPAQGVGYRAQSRDFANASPLKERPIQQIPATTTVEVPRGKYPPDSAVEDTVSSLNFSTTTLCSTVANQPTSRQLTKPGQQKDCDLAMHVQEGLARLQSRFDNYVADRHSESTWANAEIKRVREETADKWSSHMAMMEKLESRLAYLERGDEITAACKLVEEKVLELETRVSEVQPNCIASFERNLADEAEQLRRTIAQESEARLELQVAIGKDVREQLATEAERLQGSVMREMRERMDGQKVLRDEVQFQQQALNHLQSKVDEMLMELRTEMPRIAQELTDRSDELESLCTSRLDGFERNLSEEATARRTERRSLADDLREQAAAETARVASQLREVLEVAEAAAAATRRADEKLDRTSRKTNDVEETVQRLGRRLQLQEEALPQQAADLERRMAEREADVRSAIEKEVQESEVGLRGYLKSSTKDSEASIKTWSETFTRNLVDSEVLTRVDALDVSLRQTEAGLRGWVDSTVVARLSALESQSAAVRASPHPQVQSSSVMRDPNARVMPSGQHVHPTTHPAQASLGHATVIRQTVNGPVPMHYRQ